MSLRIPGRVATISNSSPGGKLNTGNGDAYQGGSQSNFSGRRGGMLGQLEELEESVANLYSDTSVATLHAGWIQYVQLDSASPTPIQGGLLFADVAAFSTGGTYKVTTDPTNLGAVVGVCILASWTPGNYWWMYTGGVALVQYLATLGTGSAAYGSVVISATDGGTPARGRGDVAPTTFTTVSLGKVIGRQVVAATNGGLALVNLNLTFTNPLV